MTKLLGLQYKITYKKGQENVVADALSRYPNQEMYSISRATPVWLENVAQGYYEDEQAQNLLPAWQLVKIQIISS